MSEQYINEISENKKQNLANLGHKQICNQRQISQVTQVQTLTIWTSILLYPQKIRNLVEAVCGSPPFSLGNNFINESKIGKKINWHLYWPLNSKFIKGIPLLQLFNQFNFDKSLFTTKQALQQNFTAYFNMNHENIHQIQRKQKKSSYQDINLSSQSDATKQHPSCKNFNSKGQATPLLPHCKTNPQKTKIL